METTDVTNGLRLRPLGPSDVAAGERLSREVGWNQNSNDWAYILSRGLGWGYEDDAGHLGATAMILPYGEKIAWICMVLVTASWRKRGLATALLRHCIDQAEGHGWVPGLDATEAGRQVYLPLGFRDILPLARFVAEPVHDLEVADNDTCRLMTEADLPTVARLDEASAGASRVELIKSLLSRAPYFCWVSEQNGVIEGFSLGRDGADADQIGPIVSGNDKVAITLACCALHARPDPIRRIYIDALTNQNSFCRWLGDRGFAKQRGFSRMLKGRTTPLGDVECLFAIAGPELA